MDAPESSPRDVSARVTELELLFMHLQQTLADLDGVVRGQQQQLEHLRRQLAQQTQSLANLGDALYEPPSLEDERPPHY
ncbi:MAG: SlyX family protein [Pirellulales bacterium]|nr:SlyX family protein [Pirellulales bacterium]